MINKKASITLTILVFSFLIISSGALIVNGIKKSDNKNIVTTGNIISEQNNKDVGLSEDTPVMEEKFISKKSSGSGRSDDVNSLTYIEPENLSNRGDLENQTPENQTEANSTEFTNFGIQFSDSYIFEENGTEYIVRDGAAYALASSSYYITFDSSLPSSICENEKINIIVKGEAKFYPDYGDTLDCALDGHVHVSWCIDLMEDDGVLPDDLVTWKCDSSKVNSDGFSGCESSFYFEAKISGVDLTDAIIFDPGANGEFYAKIYDFDNKVGKMSTSSYDVSVNYNCDCLSGPCCNNATRPYNYKNFLSQPTGYSDSYYCSGTNSPTGTSYCMKRDYYCKGNSSSAFHTDSTKDTCGICKYCTDGDSTCNFYSSSAKCGTRSCNHLDTSCRDYTDADKHCNGAGSCINDSCISYTDNSKHTSCGTGKECDGYGACITCTTHDDYSCYDDDVYWFDLCDNREGKKTECGQNSESDWNYYCKGSERWKKKICTTKGCLNSACFSETYDCYSSKVETCQYGCLSGTCKSDPNIVCYRDSDCGQDGYSSPWCERDDVYNWFIDWKCNNPGTASSSCNHTDTLHLQEDCGEDSYNGSNYCFNNDVYINVTNRGCSGVSCFSNFTKKLVEDCEDGQCVNGTCQGLRKPDLVVLDSVVQSIRGRNVTLAFTIKNIGELVANNVYWMVDTNSTSSGSMKRTSSVSFNPGNWTRAYMMWTYSSSGSYYPKIIVDFDNTIRESNESNNMQSVSVNV